MSSRTEAKDKQKKAKLQRFAGRREREISQLMEIFCFSPYYSKLDHSTKSRIHKYPHPELDVVAGQTMQGDSKCARILESVHSAVNTGHVDYMSGCQIPLKQLFEFVGLGANICQLLGIAPTQVHEKHFKDRADEAGLFANAFARFLRDSYAEFLAKLWTTQVSWPLINESFPGGSLYWESLISGPEEQSTFRIEKLTTEPIYATIAGKSRPTWACCAVQEPGQPPRPIKWSAEQIGIQGSGTFPVHIQSHATKNWHERLPKILVHPMLFYNSILDPQFVDVRKGKGKVAYGKSIHHFGYFTFELTDGIIVITTFLFLTMEGTPEYRSLHQRLRAVRADIEENRLDRAESFFCSDLRLDPQIKEILSDCGLGHLLRPAPEIGPIIRPISSARIRKYFNIPTSK